MAVVFRSVMKQKIMAKGKEVAHLKPAEKQRKGEPDRKGDGNYNLLDVSPCPS